MNLKQIKMKKLLFISTLALTLLACTPEEIETTKAPEPVVDCYCDRIVTQSTFNIIGTPSNPTGTILIKGTTVNDCTKLTRDYSYSISKIYVNQIPKIGTCKY